VAVAEKGKHFAKIGFYFNLIALLAEHIFSISIKKKRIWYFMREALEKAWTPPDSNRHKYLRSVICEIDLTSKSSPNIFNIICFPHENGNHQSTSVLLMIHKAL
jgi:hypothetical protein